MIFRRKIYDQLIDWKCKQNGKTALLIEGARRIGKTTAVMQFAEKEYRSNLVIDFSKASDEVKGYFSKHINDLDTLFMLLSTQYGVALHERESLIVFDEVQLCPKAREAIKHLVADGRYDYVETGSLISIRDNVKDILIPSEEHAVKMYPMDFEEFCEALGEEMLVDYIRQCYIKIQHLERELHDKAMLMFKQYMLIGGMPQSVAAFIEYKKKFEPVDEKKRDILALYRNDMGKIESGYRSKVIKVFDQIPGLLSKHEKRVRMSNISTDSSTEQMENAFFWLADSMIVNECVKSSDPNVVLSLTEDRTYIKCYLGDTGLLVSHAFDENQLLEDEVYKQILNDKLEINKGMLYGNLIAQMLIANGHRLFYYTEYNPDKHRNDIEIDFMLSSGGKTKAKIIPIEVKSGKRYQTKSLEKFIKKYGKRIDTAYIIHPKNLAVKNDVVCIPAYMTFCL